MITGLYAVLDVKAKSYGNILYFANDDMAKRAMSMPIPADNDMAKWPEDFHMYQLGLMDTDSGEIQPNTPRLVAAFSQFVKKEA